MGRSTLCFSPPTSLGLSGSRPLFPHEYSTRREGIHTLWAARVDEKPLSRWTLLPSPRAWWTAVLEFRDRAPLLVRFSRELARNNGATFWVLIGLSALQSCILSGG